MRKLAHLFTDLLLGPPPSSLGAAPAPRARVDTSDGPPVAEVVVVDEADQHLHDFLELFPAESAEVTGASPRRRQRLGA